MIGLYTTNFADYAPSHNYAYQDSGTGVIKHWMIHSRKATENDRANSTHECFSLLTYIRDYSTSLIDYSGLSLISTSVNTDESPNIFVSLMLERPVLMTQTINGSSEINMDFVYGSNYNLMLNFQRNTTNLTEYIHNVTKLQIEIDTLYWFLSPINETKRDELFNLFDQVIYYQNETDYYETATTTSSLDYPTL